MSEDENAGQNADDRKPIFDENDERLRQVHFQYTSYALVAFSRRSKFKKYENLLIAESKRLLWDPSAANDN